MLAHETHFRGNTVEPKDDINREQCGISEVITKVRKRQTAATLSLSSFPIFVLS